MIFRQIQKGRIGQQGEEITTLFGSWLEQGVEAGEIDPALDLKNVCGLLESALFGLAWYRSMITRTWDWQAMYPLLVRLLDRGLSAS